MKKKFIIIIVIAIVLLGGIIAALFNPYAIKGREYKNAIRLAKSGEYAKAIEMFQELGDFKESKIHIENYTIVMTREMYEEATALLEDKKYNEAASLFLELGNYKDAKEQAAEAKLLGQMESIQDVNVGDEIAFGTYEQDNETENGAEEIEWLVMDKKGDKALLVTKYAIACRKYHATYVDTTWSTASTRTWLNSEFMDEAFLDAQKKMIVETTLENPDNPKSKTDGGPDTTDQVFLLSVDEVNRYFKTAEDKMCKPTAFAIARGSHADEKSGNCIWWLRTPGANKLGSSFVSVEGDINMGGYLIDYRDCSVRPAMWVKLK